VSDMNHVFSHAEDMQDMATAYYASSQISSLLVERYGRDRVNQLLRLYAKGPLAAEALPRALGGSASGVDGEFASALTRILERYRTQFVPLEARGAMGELTAQAAASPKDLTAQLRLALGALEDKQLGLAERAFADAKALDPSSADVRFLGARLSAAQGQGPAGLAELQALAQQGHDGYAVQMAIAALTDADEQPDAFEAALTKAHQFDPTQAEPLHGLWRAARAEGDEAAEVRILGQLAPLEERDASIYQRLLELHLARRAVAEAVEVGGAAIWVDLEGARTHVLYAQALALAGRFGDALFEFESAISCPSAPQELAAAHLAFADFLDSRGRAARAGTERTRARELDPDAGKPPASAPSR
jgi:cellulose synthase operon protein C